MEVKIDDIALREAGYVNAEQFRHVSLSFNVVAKILGVSVSTVISYAKAGFIPTGDDDKILLADALKIDFKELHDKYIKSRNLVSNRKKSRR